MARVLLVDDSTIDRRVAEEILQEADHEVLLASDGRQALDLVREQAPDVIVTDLQMPNLDGLGLVTSLQIESPSIPVILMTAHGSEDMANQALRSGATSYVPKSELSRLLQSSVETILSAVHREQTYAQLIGYAERAAFHFSLDNDPELIEPLVDLIQQMIRNVCEIDETEQLRTAVALEAVLTNAVYRGNLELSGKVSPLDAEERRHLRPYADRKTRVCAEVESSCIRFEVSDDGPGFDSTQFGQNEEAILGGGRGIMLMRTLMDEVTFSRNGRTVELVKHISSSVDTKNEMKVLARLVPTQSDTPIDITKRRVNIGRDRSCDVILAFSDVSGHHCQLYLHLGWWYVKDLQTKNGTRIDGVRIKRKRMRPGDEISIAKHTFTIQYDPGELGAIGPTPPPDPW
ncbi:MAG: response regulator [Pirellulaceae bacterium]